KIDLDFEKQVVYQANAVLTHCHSSNKLLGDRYKNCASKMQVLTMGYEEAEFETSINPRVDDTFIIAYTGTLTPLYAAEYFLSAFSSLVSKHPQKKLKLKLAGTIYEHFFDEVQRFGLEENVEYLGYLPHFESIKLIK